MPRFAHNHVVLITNVFPSEPGETGPKGSALSLLVFYAQSKPQKLVKVGAFLEKKVKADLRHGKKGHVEVALEIVNTLMLKCTPHITIMSKNVLNIIGDVLGSPDPDLMLGATNVFVVFNSLLSHESAVDGEFLNLYENLIVRFSKCCTYQTRDSLFEKKMHIAGLRAIKAVTASEAFLSSPHLSFYVKAIVPAILSNLREGRSSIHKSSEKDEQPELAPAMPHRVSIADELFSEEQVEDSAEASLRQLFTDTNASNLKIVLTPLLSYFDSSEEWKSPTLVLHVVQILISAVQPQYHYYILSAILERLNDVSISEDVNAKLALVQSLIFIIVYGSGTIGIAAVELVDTILNLILSGSKLKDDVDFSLPYISNLVDAVGALAVHMDYPTQFNDILSFLANRLKVGEYRTVVEGPVAKDNQIARKAVLHCLIRVVAVRRLCNSERILRPDDATASGRSQQLFVAPGPDFLIRVISASSPQLPRRESFSHGSLKRSFVVVVPVPPALIVPVSEFLGDADLSIRSAAALFLSDFLRLDSSMCETVLASPPSLPSPSSIGAEAMAENTEALLLTLVDKVNRYAGRPLGSPVDFIAIGCLLQSILERCKDLNDPVKVALAPVISLVFKLESTIETALAGHSDAAQDKAISSRAAFNLMIDVLLAIARVFKAPKLSSHVDNVRRDYQAGGHWVSALPPLTRLDVLAATVESGQTTRGMYTDNIADEPAMSLSVSFTDLAPFQSEPVSGSPAAPKLNRATIVDLLLSSSEVLEGKSINKASLESESAIGLGGLLQSLPLFTTPSRKAGVDLFGASSAERKSRSPSAVRNLSVSRTPSVKSAPKTPVSSDLADLVVRSGSPVDPLPSSKPKINAKILLKEITGTVKDSLSRSNLTLREPQPKGGSVPSLNVGSGRTPSVSSESSAASSVKLTVHPFAGMISSSTFRSPSPIVSLSVPLSTDSGTVSTAVGPTLRHSRSQTLRLQEPSIRTFG
ncbi:hypothetical protein DFJ73DRAFT_758331 [Zopfochytrium polystomum]|nr:hypothetical protein DFJ73DRAFT_758331 [Zopfochytrium polystomum]